MLAFLISFFRNNTMRLYPDDLKTTLGYHERINRGKVPGENGDAKAGDDRRMCWTRLSRKTECASSWPNYAC